MTQAAPAATGALEGLVVLDLTRMLAGPYATMMPVSYTHLTLPTKA